MLGSTNKILGVLTDRLTVLYRGTGCRPSLVNTCFFYMNVTNELVIASNTILHFITLGVLSYKNMLKALRKVLRIDIRICMVLESETRTGRLSVGRPPTRLTDYIMKVARKGGRWRRLKIVMAFYGQHYVQQWPSYRL